MGLTSAQPAGFVGWRVAGSLQRLDPTAIGSVQANGFAVYLPVS